MKSQLVIAEVVEVVMCAAGFVPGHAAQAAVDGLALEDGASRLDSGDDVASCELGCAGALMESADGVDTQRDAVIDRIDPDHLATARDALARVAGDEHHGGW